MQQQQQHTEDVNSKRFVENSAEETLRENVVQTLGGVASTKRVLPETE